MDSDSRTGARPRSRPFVFGFVLLCRDFRALVNMDRTRAGAKYWYGDISSPFFVQYENGYAAAKYQYQMYLSIYLLELFCIFMLLSSKISILKWIKGGCSEEFSLLLQVALNTWANVNWSEPTKDEQPENWTVSKTRTPSLYLSHPSFCIHR